MSRVPVVSSVQIFPLICDYSATRHIHPLQMPSPSLYRSTDLQRIEDCQVSQARRRPSFVFPKISQAPHLTTGNFDAVHSRSGTCFYLPPPLLPSPIHPLILFRRDAFTNETSSVWPHKDHWCLLVNPQLRLWIRRLRGVLPTVDSNEEGKYE